LTGYCGTISNNTILPTECVIGNKGLNINSGTVSILPNSNLLLSERSIITVAPTAGLSIGSNCTITGYNYTVVHDETSPVWVNNGNKIVVYGNLSVSNNVNFYAESDNYWDGLVIDNNNSIFINDATFTKCNLSKKNGQLAVNNSSFIESNISCDAAYFFIEDCSIVGSIYCKNSPSAFILECNVTGQGDGITLSTCADYGIYNSNISGGTGNGISIYETNGISSYHISDCYISDNDGAGIRLYNSIANVTSCSITGNDYQGIAAFRVSNLTIQKDPNTAAYYLDCYIANNGMQEISFVNSTNLFADRAKNMIVDNSFALGTFDQYLVYCPNMETNRWLRLNFWGYRDNHSVAIMPPENRFYPECTEPMFNEVGYYLSPVWDPGIPRIVDPDNDEIVFQTAIDAALDENASLAITLFKQLISEYPESKFCSASAKHLFALEDDKQALKDYYQTEPNLHYNGEIDKIIDYLTTHCNIKLGNYQEAIAWFEDVISNPHSEIDSLMAVIDLGYVYMLMEGDDKASVICRYPQLKPKTMSDYETNRESILVNLFGTVENQAGYTDSEYTEQAIMPVLRSNFPNPFNPTTTISFLLPKDATCTLDVYNIRGQKVKNLINETRFAGNHSVVWNGLDDNGKPVSSGLYFYRLTTPNSSQTNKMLLLK